MAINVMVVDDSILVRVILKDILEERTEGEKEKIRVVASVSNGQEALKEIAINPNIDVITLDVRMPEKDGLETLKEMQKIRRVPVVMISSYTNGGANQTIEALSLGAVDFITKEGDEMANSLYDMSNEIREKIITASKAKTETFGMVQETGLHINIGNQIKHIIGVGSSTGGPAALRVLFSQIPQEFNAPILISQHMPAGSFIASLAKSLNEISHYEVKVMENGEEIKNNTAYLCPGGLSAEVFKRGTKLNIVLTKKTDEIIYTPSVNLMFSSIARLESSIKKTGIVLTGMGDDGTKGSLAIYQNGGTIIAESEKTSIVYGMPKKVALLDIEKHVADIDKIFNYVPKV